MRPLRHHVIRLLLCLFSLPVWAAPLPSPYSQLFFFGDSLSDNGNVFALTGGFAPAAPYVDGRFSNGPVAAEYMAAALGLGLTDFAFGGAKTGIDTDGNDSYLGVNGTGMQAQVDMFEAALAGSPADAAALYGVWGGPNDYFEAGMTPDVSVSNLSLIVADLYALGARDFFVPNMPDLGLTPAFRGSAEQGNMTLLSIGFNALLDASIAQLRLDLGDANIVTFDTFSFLRSAIDQPATLGFDNVIDPCIGSVACLSDPALQDGYLFFDAVHPTTAAHGELGLAFARSVAVSEPGMISLVGLALMGLFGVRYRSGARIGGSGVVLR